MSAASHDKLRIALRYSLQGANNATRIYRPALDALAFMEEHTIGYRKDKITPNWVHPVEVAAYLLTIQHSLRNPVAVIAGALLHDVVEDGNVTIAKLVEMFGEEIALAVKRVSKVIEGTKVISLDDHFFWMLDNPHSPVIKGADRINNQGTMIDVFSPEKQMEYVDESQRYILPMLKEARRKYADQEPALQNIKLILENQICMIRAMNRKV
jgi:GTP pyrophosphokinase